MKSESSRPQKPEGRLCREIQVLSSDTDCFQRMRMSVLFRYLQEISILDTELAGVTREKTLDRGLLWVIAKINLELERPILYDETITLRTWPQKTKHMLFPRQYDIIDAHGTQIARAVALWLLIQKEKRTIIFPNAYGISIPERPQENELSMPPALESLQGETTVEKRMARFSEIDLNGHVNNTEYLNWIDDLYTMEEHAASFFHGIRIDYRKETAAGSLIELRKTSTEKRDRIDGLEDGSPIFTALLERRPVRKV